MKDLRLAYLGQSLMIAALAYVALNAVMFLAYYGPTLAPWSIPYREDFTDLARLDFRQWGGLWQVQDGALVQSVQDGTDLMAVIPLALTTDERYQYSAHINFRHGPKGGGLMFNLQHAESRQDSHMLRFGESNTGETYLVYGYFDSDLAFKAQGSLTPFDLSGAAEGIKLGVQVGTENYNILVNDQPVVRDVPLMYRGGLLALTTWFSQIAFDDITVMPWDGTVFSAAPADQPGQIFSDSFDDESSRTRWQSLGGDWRFEPGALVQGDSQGFDYANVLLVPFENIHYRVQFSQQQGSGAGMLFNVPQAESVRGGHMLRYFPDNRLVWGYYDLDGVFKGQGNAVVNNPGNAVHILEVRTDGATYSIVLDGAAVATGVPLTSSSGYVGLTTSQSAAVFYEVEVAPGELPPLTFEAIPAPADQWRQDGEMITQSDAALAAYNRPVDIHGINFDAGLDLTLPAVDGVSGGLIIHSSNAAVPTEAYTVRIASSGEVVWGRYDAQTGFQAEGRAAVTLVDGMQALNLQIQDGLLSIILNGTLVAQDVTLPTRSGWLFFDAFGGPVSFANFRMNLTQIGN